MANNNNGPNAKAITRNSLLKTLASLMMAGAVMVLAIADVLLVQHNNDLRKESACRFDVSTSVNSIADRIDVLTAEIFVAEIDNDEATVQRLGDELDTAIDQLLPALEERKRAVEGCKES